MSYLKHHSVDSAILRYATTAIADLSVLTEREYRSTIEHYHPICCFF